MDPCLISILIPAKNDAANLRRCLASCAFADQVVVVDSSSSDDTAAVVRGAGAQLVNFNWDGSFPKKKNWALQNIPWRHEWVFILDADECITPELASELRAVVANPTCEGYYVNRRFWFLDGWLKHCGYYPSWNLRFFRHRRGRYEQLSGVGATDSGDNEVHEHVILDGRCGHLRHEMEHYAFPTIAVWVDKHNRYSNWEARLALSDAASVAAARAPLTPTLARKRRLKHFARLLPMRPTLRFLYHFIWRAGFLDGYRGFVFCRLMGFYEFLSVAKLAELRRGGGGGQ